MKEDRKPSVRDRLRAATMGAHERAHGLDAFAAISNGTLTADRYRELLKSLLAFHAIIGFGAAAYGWSSLSSAPQRLALLQRDLLFMGGAAPPNAAAWTLRSQYAALGALYAAEGSMLGGRVIAGQLDFLFGAGVDGRRFFTGSKGDGTRWRTLLDVLKTRCRANGPLDEAIGGALFAFSLFEQCVVGQDTNCGVRGAIEPPHLVLMAGSVALA